MRIALSPEAYDEAIGKGLEARRVLPQASPVEVIAKPNCTEAGNGGVVISFQVVLPDGTLAWAQATTTATLVEMAGKAISGWKAGGHL